jgi:hypothetical protein
VPARSNPADSTTQLIPIRDSQKLNSEMVETTRQSAGKTRDGK